MIDVVVTQHCMYTREYARQKSELGNSSWFFGTARLACVFWLARSCCSVSPALLFGSLLALGCLLLFTGLAVGFVLLAAGCFWLLVALMLSGLLAAGWLCFAWFASGCLLPAFAGSLLGVRC